MECLLLAYFINALVTSFEAFLIFFATDRHMDRHKEPLLHMHVVFQVEGGRSRHSVHMCMLQPDC